MFFYVHEVEFKNKLDFFKALGYSRPLSPAQIKNQYKGIDNLIKTRLNLVNDSDIEPKLKELKERFYNSSECQEQKNIYPENYFLLNAVYKTAFKMLTAEQQQTIIQTVATLKNIDADSLMSEISEDLKSI